MNVGGGDGACAALLLLPDEPAGGVEVDGEAFEASGFTYGTTLKPKKSFPKGRLSGAGALAPVSRVSFDTTRRLLCQTSR